MKKYVALLALILLGFAVWPMLEWNENPGRGEKIGQIILINEQGRLWTWTGGLVTACKSWEGQLIRGGLDDGTGAFGVKPFDFTVPTDELARKVKHYMLTQTEVSVKYNTDYVYFKCNSESSGIFLTDVEPIKDAAKKKR